MKKIPNQITNQLGTKLFCSGLFLFIAASLITLAAYTVGSAERASLLLSPEQYHDAHFAGVWEKLYHRIKIQPINLMFLAVFLCAVIHTFAAFSFKKMVKMKRTGAVDPSTTIGIAHPVAKQSDFFSEIIYFFGEVEVIFGLWCIPLLLAITYAYDWSTALNYVNSLNYSESLFLMVSLALCSTRPIIQLAEKWLGKLAILGGGTPSAWWITLLTAGPILGAVFKESVAMTILAILLSRFFYKFHPSQRLAYSTLALLFLYISMAGMLTSFASSSVYVIKGPWKWDTAYMLQTFGWKILLGILLCNTLYFFIFYADFNKLDRHAAQTEEKEKPGLPIPYWITFVHVAVLVWIIFNSENNPN